ncbi:MAG: neutral/alkaline non-lysosomal ceramidase N-terminal domain-containing protein [Anaerolineae bacterium]|nr:neutral/alkaline non-lysosomal ceramidase N-terminal domain-containing protein [Anaerolineae bacterium]
MKYLLAGTGVADVTPVDPQYLFGYPHVARISTGVHDPLLSSALYLFDGRTPLLFIANDIIFIGKATAGRVRQRIETATGVPAANILVSATHTHSGPSTVDYISLADDPFVPKVDARYLQLFEDGIVAAAVDAVQRAQPAEAGLAIAAGAGVGTNRRDPAGPADPRVPVFLARSTANGAPIACMLVCSMHPTVLREGSTVVTGDFPGMARRYLQEHLLGPDCAVLHHTGPAGNQSPRHVLRGNTVAEAQRLGDTLGHSVADAIDKIAFISALDLDAQRALVELPRRAFPPVADAERRLQHAAKKLAHLRQMGAPPQEVRGAEVDWFGAEETVRLARLAAAGKLVDAHRSCLPAEVQAFRLGPWTFVGWPGEVFVEYALAVKAAARDTYVISLANGELQGYITTEAAAAEGGYEASNAIFAPAAGQTLVEATLRLVAR